MVLSDKDAPRKSASNLKEVDGQDVLCTSHWYASEAVLSVVPVEGHAISWQGCWFSCPTIQVFYVHPINSTWNNGESSLADDIWSTGDEFVVCEEQPEFDDSSGAVEGCVSHSDPARSSLQLLAAVYF